MPAFALTIFTGAFLLFQIQPLVGKYILPWFGGGPGVWTTCMLFFQLVLLGGYAYAHTVSRHLKPRSQAVLHTVLLLAALASLPITPGDAWKPAAGSDPAWRILALLTVSLGLPYFVLSATGPLMQEWFRRTVPGASPYRLYALSNVGSLLALISYPFYFETNFTRLAQARFWSWGLVFYATCCGWCAWRLWRTPPVAEPAAAPGTTGDIARPTASQRALWVCLPAVASVLLLAVTNKMCQDVAVIPFLWVLPLALYLLSFIISFDSPRWYSRFYYTVMLAVALVAVCLALFAGADMPIVQQVVIYSATMAVGCMICHGELYRLRPDPAHLTSFYLLISAGGALGGLFVALVAPAVFNNFYEIHLALALVVVLLLAVCFTDRAALTPLRWRVLAGLLGLASVYGLDRALTFGATWARYRSDPGFSRVADFWSASQVAGLHWPLWVLAGLLFGLGFVLLRRRPAALDGHRATCALLGAGLCALVVVLGVQIKNSSAGALVSTRNFYGVLSVYEYDKDRPDSHYYLLQHGRITHGIQFAAPDRERMITSYFGSRTGLGLALRQFPRQQNQRIGLLGLGVGTITAYGKPGDYIRVYEIDPEVKRVAEKPFTYLARSSAQIELVMGDGRLSLENEPPQNFDFLIMDAFSSDAVPVHLLTKEAFEIYTRHLKPDGVILVNISNRYLNLRPVVENAAREFHFESHHIECEDGSDDEDEGAWWLYGSTWMVLSKNREFMLNPALRTAASPGSPGPNGIPLWTDDYTSMFRVLQ
ncbi:MAG: fused MFS/spermidine synthase [Verrucomicrobia bacterium]|nr:fused MFS/spermidine synthase [Verrucomicrobiota bacterium]